MPRGDTSKRGFAAQRHRRTAERMVRIAALVFCRWAAQQGLVRAGWAASLRMSPRTLARWQHGWRQDRLAPHARGRPARRLDRLDRQHVIGTVRLMGPGVGVAALKGIFPGAARRELAYLLRRYRAMHVRKCAVLACVLHWEEPGAVWAMDYTRPPTAVDGTYRHLLVVRDMASGYQLLALPAERAASELTAQALTGLFHEHGPPLVIKSDNDSAFRGAQTQATLLDWKVFSLLSPPAMPRYNGASEAGIGALKVRAHWEAARHGRAGHWTTDDVEAARLQANQMPRPNGHASLSPETLWKDRSPITHQDRSEFARTVELCRPEAFRRYELSAQEELTVRERDAIDRFAVSRALGAHGFLTVTRRRITLPIRSVFRAKIT